jgi:hypothetical protein
MTASTASESVRARARYTLRLFAVLLCGVAIGTVLVLLNPDLGLFAWLMLLNIGAVSLLAAYFAFQAILKRESLRWTGYSYLVLLLAAIIWAAVDM